MCTIRTTPPEGSRSRTRRRTAAASVVFPEPAGPSTQTRRPAPRVGGSASRDSTTEAASASTAGNRDVTRRCPPRGGRGRCPPPSRDAVLLEDRLDVVHVVVLDRGLGRARAALGGQGLVVTGRPLAASGRPVTTR